MNGWCEVGVGLQRNDDGGCATMARKIGISGGPWCICRWLSFARPFLIGSDFLSDCPPEFGGLLSGEGWDAGCRDMMRLG